MSKKRPGDTDFTDFTDYNVVISVSSARSVVFSIGAARIQEEKSARIRAIRVLSFVNGFGSFAYRGCMGSYRSP
ncbi:MAG: hypothetical protein Q8M95_08385 [Candidatus Methanoperedens sp.]|nr:hypothetical protein [Candidatus Methanoperedens sp.]